MNAVIWNTKRTEPIQILYARQTHHEFRLFQAVHWLGSPRRKPFLKYRWNAAISMKTQWILTILFVPTLKIGEKNGILPVFQVYLLQVWIMSVHCPTLAMVHSVLCWYSKMLNHSIYFFLVNFNILFQYWMQVTAEMIYKQGIEMKKNWRSVLVKCIQNENWNVCQFFISILSIEKKGARELILFIAKICGVNWTFTT